MPITRHPTGEPLGALPAVRGKRWKTILLSVFLYALSMATRIDSSGKPTRGWHLAAGIWLDPELFRSGWTMLVAAASLVVNACYLIVVVIYMTTSLRHRGGESIPLMKQLASIGLKLAVGATGLMLIAQSMSIYWSGLHALPMGIAFWFAAYVLLARAIA